MTPEELIAELVAIRDRINVLLHAADATPRRGHLIDQLEPDGAWRPGWLVALNALAHAHRPDGFVNSQGAIRQTPMILIHSVLWWPILGRQDLTPEQRETYDHLQRTGFGQWMIYGSSRWPIMPWPRTDEDWLKPGGEVRFAVLAGPQPGMGALPTEVALRECIESHYRASDFLPPE